MILFFTLLLSSISSVSYARSPQPALVCQIHQEGVEWVEFRRESFPGEHTNVRVSWANGSQSVLVMRENFDEWHQRGFQLNLRSPYGMPLLLDVRAERNQLFGIFRGTDGSPFPVSCVSSYFFLAL